MKPITDRSGGNHVAYRSTGLVHRGPLGSFNEHGLLHSYNCAVVKTLLSFESNGSWAPVFIFVLKRCQMGAVREHARAQSVNRSVADVNKNQGMAWFMEIAV